MKELIVKIRQSLFIKAAYRLIQNNGIEFSGYLAYLNIFSIFPFIFILVTILAVLGATKSGTLVIEEVYNFSPPYLIEIIKPHITELLAGPPSSLLNFVFIGAIWTSSSSVESLKQIFNQIYNVENPPHFIMSRIKSIIQFICAILIILLSMTVFVILPLIFIYLENHFSLQLPDIGTPLFRNLSISIIMISVIAGIYYSLTNKKLSFLTTVPGAGVSFIIWYISAKCLTFYVNNFNQLNITYGSLATLIIVMLFFYIINFALLYGAEINFQILKKKNSNNSLFIKK